MPRPPTSLAVTGAAIAVLCALVSPVSVASSSAPASQQDPRSALAIIVNHRNPVAGLSMSEVRRIFLLDTQFWSTGRRITLVLREEGQPQRAQALRLICDMSEVEYRRHLLRQLFRGRPGSAVPRTIRTTEGMLAFVFNAPGAIGHVEATRVDSTVKVLRVDGRLPSDSGYPLSALSSASQLRRVSASQSGTGWPGGVAWWR
jgi:ABC-type phosphate transport system substrate-binding protein